MQIAPPDSAGVDEAGRGPCAGPVVAAAVIIPENIHGLSWIGEIKDSKKLLPARREKLYGLISAHCICATAQASVAEIDAVNILQASLLAMRRAVEKLAQNPGLVLVDGNKLPDWNLKSQAVIGGDDKIVQIAAASILAKVARDAIMRDLSAHHPHYGWEKNSGYPTAYHLKALQTHGATEHHRKSFAPVARILDSKKAA